MLVRSSWVDYDGDMYFVNSAGQKITSDWRLTTPYDDEDAEEEWYYFQASGKMATNKKIVYKGSIQPSMVNETPAAYGAEICGAVFLRPDFAVVSH